MRIVLFLVAALWLALSAEAQDRKLALLIGNQDYPDQIGDLATPHMDVTTLAAALEASGFETYAHFDTERDEMQTAIKAFRTKLAEAQIENDKVFGFVYFAGQGFSISDAMGDQNLLVASRTHVWNSEDLMKQTLFFDDAVATLMSARPDALYVVNDSVREGLALGFTDPERATGFVPHPTQAGLLVAYSAAAGERAPDDGEFAKTLAREIVVEGQLASVAINKALDAVAASTPQRGAPFIDLGRLEVAFCFNGCPLNDDEPLAEEEEEIDLASLRPPSSGMNAPQPRAPQIPLQLIGEAFPGDDAAAQPASLDPTSASIQSSPSSVSARPAQTPPQPAANAATAAPSSGSGMLGTAAKAGASVAGSATSTVASVATGAAQTAVSTQVAATQAVQTQATIGAATAAAGMASSGVKAGAGLAGAGVKALTGGGGSGAPAPSTPVAAATPASAADGLNRATEASSPPASQAAEPATDTPTQSGGPGETPPPFPGAQIATKPPNPAYPEAAIAQDIEGLCRVNFDVSATGEPFNLMTSCSDSVFEKEAIRAVSQARFEPATVDGAPAVRENVEYPLEFSLNQPG